MLRLALKMLIGDRAKYIGMILGLSFASFIIVQQTSIFYGILKRTYGFISDTSQANIWVMDRNVQYIDDIKPMKSTRLFQVRSIPGVEWAVPLFKGILKGRLEDGNYQNCTVIGIDDATLIGAPPKMLEGKITDLRIPDGIIANKVDAEGLLAVDGRPLRIGNVIEFNDHRTAVVGICEVSRTIFSQPIVYTTFGRATTITPRERNLLSFVLVRSTPGVAVQEVCNNIMKSTGLAAYTAEQFSQLTESYYMRNTGIPINFGVAVILGFIIGIVIAGQTFFNFTQDNLRYFGTFKAMGASSKVLVRMVLVQAALVAVLGWGIGIGGAAIFGMITHGTELAFHLPWGLYLGSGVAMMLICLVAAYASVQKVIDLDPAIVFKS